ncbi:MAG: hypothetical protein K8H90_01565, partial [Thermoanaerobaculia bacterium]|nr:hypothetical protein [Thermoanaerobaculia bacterium]
MGELERYLSDAIAPLLAVDALTLLVRCPPNLVAMQCESWARQQFQAHGGSVRVSNLLFHAFKKIHVLSELGLIKGEVLAGFLESLKDLLVEACPQGERKVLADNFKHVGAGGQPVTRRVDLLFAQNQAQRPQEAARAASESVEGAVTVDVGNQLRQFGALLERLSDQVGVGKPLTGTEPATSSALQRQLIAAAVESATDEEDLLRHLEQVSQKSHRKLDVAAAIRELSQDLPDWALRSGDGQSPYQGAAAAAIDKIVELTEDPEAGAGRFWELVNSAVEQVNLRMLPRAVTLLDLAEKLAGDPDLDPRRIKASRASAAKAIDETALRELSMRPEVQRDLRRVLEFFPDWCPDGLLGQLDGELERGRRHLLLSLMELHGRAARDRCLAGLDESLGLASPDAWMWQRNLIHVLRRVPIGDHESLEFKVLEEFSSLERIPQLAREAITALGATRRDEAVAILVDRLQQVLNGLAPPHWAGEVDKLRSELALALGT